MGCPVCDKPAGAEYGDSGPAGGAGDTCPYLMSAYILAGLAMMLNIRLCYSSAPYALIRFKLPENLFSVFVRRMASSLELWCLPGFIIADIMDIGLKIYYKIQQYEKDNTSGKGTNLKTSGDFKQPRREKFGAIILPSIIAQWLNFLTYVILLFVYRGGGDQGHLTRFYWIIAVSGVVFGISNPLVFAVDWNYISIYIAGENCFPALTSFIHYIATLLFGNRRKWNSDYLIVYIDIVVAIIISFAAAVVWTVGYGVFKDGNGAPDSYEHIFTYGFDEKPPKPSMAACLLIVLVGMGLVYAIYPGIAPGMIVPFYLIDKIEMVLLVATIVPAVSVAIVCKENYLSSPKSNKGWEELSGYHVFDLVIPIMIILAYIFIYSLHYRDSKLSRAIINQPKMSTALTIIFYMCHEISLAVGFAGMVSNGAEYTVLAQLVGAFLMVFLAFYSEGYIIEYKSYDPTHWPKEGMLM